MSSFTPSSTVTPEQVGVQANAGRCSAAFDSGLRRNDGEAILRERKMA